LVGRKVFDILNYLSEITNDVLESLLSFFGLNEGLLDLIEPDLSLRDGTSAIRGGIKKFFLKL